MRLGVIVPEDVTVLLELLEGVTEVVIDDVDVGLLVFVVDAVGV